MIKPQQLEFPPLECSLASTLGDYYQDLHGAITLVESGYHGLLGDNGIPMISYGVQGSFHNAIHTAQYALANIAAVHRGETSRVDRIRDQLDWLVQAQETSGELEGCWLMTFDSPKYAWLRAPWTSALASGQAISALLRGWELFGDEHYRLAADEAYSAMHLARTNMALCLEQGDELWYEEYPADRPLHVLNGHVYALLGVVDYARVTDDSEAEDRWRRATATLLRHLGEFDLGFWSAYDLRRREPVSLHYQKNIHVPLLRILAQLTGDERFSVVADTWERDVHSVASRLRWLAELRLQRWRRPNAPRLLGRLSDAPLGSRRERISVMPDAGTGTSLRPFPYPYRAGLSLCNDPDLITPESFRRLHRFLSTEEETEWGTGLGLNVGGSFFMFCSPNSPNTFTVFDRLSGTITDDGEFILECASKGVLDALHTYGCFTDRSDFGRELAELALDTLSSRNIRIETWINHGPPTNVQCIGNAWEGDLVGAAAYHADLTIRHGVRWVWTGSEITDEVALDRCSPGSMSRGSRLTRWHHVAEEPQLVEARTLRDGQRVRSFYRYGGLGGPTPVLDDLPQQISVAKLDKLVEAGGYAIVYQHLAVRRVRPGFGPDAYRPAMTGWFKAAEVAALQGLASRYHDGEIWVVPTTRLLRYRDVHRNLRWRARREQDRDVIVARSVAADVHAGWAPRDEFRDLTFYCERPEHTDVFLEMPQGLELVEDVRRNPPDGSGSPSLTLFARD